MKKLFVITSFIFITAIPAKAQKEVLFKIQYQPNHTYSSITNIDMNMEMNYTGDEATMAQLKSSGATLPIIMNMKTGMNSDLKIGSAAAGTLPFTMAITQQPIKMTMAGKSVPQGEDAPGVKKINGIVTADGKLDIKNIEGGVLTDSIKMALEKMVKDIQADIKFPDKPLKIGDTFTQTDDVDLPIPGMAGKSSSTVTIKLLSIVDKKANFSMAMTMATGNPTPQSAMDMKGTGTGEFVYDMVTGYATSMHETMNMTFSFAIPQQQSMKMTGNMKMLMSQQTTVQ